MRKKRDKKQHERVARLRRSSGPRKNSYPVEMKLRAIEEVLGAGTAVSQVARAFGVRPKTVETWVTLFRQGGAPALEPKPLNPLPRKVSASDTVKREAVKALKQEHPEHGTRRIRDLLARFSGLGVSEAQVRRILHDAGLMPATSAPSVPREHPERRFERAEPNQLWQSDIFTFLLRRYERVYLAAFMDDHSRFLVSHALAHHQKSALVMDALHKGIAAFGAPREILTDQGRQYTAWRGSTEFEETLRREGIAHVKSRPQHPQTLGKVERFWKTLWDEFLSRTVFADFDDLQRRLSLFVDAYNFQRPHQALSGLVPADRFFRAAPQVRAAVEKNVAENAERLAHEKPVRKPFYLVGRLGDRDLTIATQGRGLTVQLGDEPTQTIELDEEVTDDERTQASNRVAGAATQATSAAGTELAEGTAGPGRDGEAALPLGAGGAVGREAGDRSDRGGEDLAPAVLPTGDQGAARDAECPCAGSRPDGAAGGDAGEGAAPRAEGAAARAGEAARGAAALRDQAGGEAGADGERDGEAAPLLDEGWEELFVGLDDEDGSGAVDAGFDPDDGWRDRALSWERKLAGADAASDHRAHDQEQELRARTGGAGGAGGALRSDPRSAGEPADGDRGSEATWPVTESLSDAAASRDGGDARRHEPESGGSADSAAEGSGAVRGERAPQAGESEAAGAGGHDRSAPGSGGGSAQGEDQIQRTPAPTAVSDDDDGEQR